MTQLLDPSGQKASEEYARFEAHCIRGYLAVSCPVLPLFEAPRTHPLQLLRCRLRSRRCTFRQEQKLRFRTHLDGHHGWVLLKCTVLIPSAGRARAASVFDIDDAEFARRMQPFGSTNKSRADPAHQPQAGYWIFC